MPTAATTAVACIALSWGEARAQALRLSVEYEAAGRGTLRPSGHAPGAGAGATASFASPRVEVGFPLFLGRGGTFVVGTFRVEPLFLSQRGWSASEEQARPDRGHRIGFEAHVTRRLPGPWRLQWHVQPALHSDLGEMDGSHVTVESVAFVDRILESGVVVGGGGYYGEVFGASRLLPALHLRAETGAVRVEALLPRRAALSWRVSPGLGLGAEARVDGARIRRADPAGPRDGHSFRHSSGTLGPALSLDLSDRLSAGLVAGTTFRRRLVLEETDGSRIRLRLTDEPFVRVHLRFRGF